MKPVMVYDSLLKTLVPLNSEGKVLKVYFCGPTVYNDAHLGNFRPPVFFDFFKRFLTYIGQEVYLVSNITDIDDQIIAKAQAEGVTETEITKLYGKRYADVLARLNVTSLDETPKVTETIPEIIALIETLIERGSAYTVNGNTYFRTRKIAAEMPEYGALANINIEELRSGARVEENPEKEDPLDFALWKNDMSGMYWNTPFGPGRPGWHSECVAMIHKIFAGPVDIHSGGFDLKFPHHTNEAAQYWAAYKTPIARIWMHMGFLQVNNEKMSKSLGNVLTGMNATDTYDPNALRLFLIASDYRSPINFSEAAIENSTNEVKKLIQVWRSLQVYILVNNGNQTIKHFHVLEAEMAPFLDHLANDFNVANALSVTHEVAKSANLALRREDLEACIHLENILFQMLSIFGFKLIIPKLSEDDLLLLSEYHSARANKNYQRSDQLRKLLSERQII